MINLHEEMLEEVSVGSGWLIVPMNCFGDDFLNES